MKYFLAVLLTTIGLTGCGDTTAPKPQPASSTATTVKSSFPTPKLGNCYLLDIAAASARATDDPPVSCQKKHTAITVKTGELKRVYQGHLLALDSATVQFWLSQTCTKAVAKWVGGDETKLNISMLRPIWFSPSLVETIQGANWYRCDVVSLTGSGKLELLTSDLKAALKNNLSEYGICSDQAPAENNSAKFPCKQAHTWRVISSVQLPADANYLDPGGKAVLDKICKDAAGAEASDPLNFRWAAEWPTKAAWDAGSRGGLCWVPTTR